MLHLLKSKAFLLILVTLVILVVMGISANKSSETNQVNNTISIVVSPVQSFFSFCAQKVEDGLSFFGDMNAIKQENKSLKLDLEKSENRNRELLGYEEENKRLREALNFKTRFNEYQPVGANIIAKDAGNLFNVFTIDRGSKDGIMRDFSVITGQGLVGCVTSARPFSSQIISIIDEDSRVSAIITKSRGEGIVRGDFSLKNQGLCRMDYISPDEDISAGDMIETSGVGGVFPKGIRIGKVKEVRKVNNELSRYAIIEPSVDFKKLEEVIVLKGKNPEIGSAEK